MDARDDAQDPFSERACRLVAHLDGALDESMLDAIQGVWMALEHAAADAPAHARAVRSRMFWESLAPGGAAAAPVLLPVALELVAAWDEASSENEQAGADDDSVDHAAAA